MGKITEQNRRILEEIKEFDEKMLTGMVEYTFCEELDKMIVEKGYSTQKIVNQSCLSKAYINKLRNRSEKKARPSRNAVIDIALALDASLDETNLLLKCAKYQELYTRNPAEAIIIWGLLKKKTGKEIREMLDERGYLNQLFFERDRK